MILSVIFINFYEESTDFPSCEAEKNHKETRELRFFPAASDGSDLMFFNSNSSPSIFFQAMLADCQIMMIHLKFFRGLIDGCNKCQIKLFFFWRILEDFTIEDNLFK